MGLKDLHLLAGDDGAAHAANQLFRFAAEHHARDDFDPPGTARLLEHGPSRYTATGQGSNVQKGRWDEGRGRGGSRKSSKLADFRGISHSSSVFMRVSAPPHQGDRSEQG